MSTETTSTGPEAHKSWLWDHIGRLAGLCLAFVAIGFIALLAVAGYPPAIGLLVFIVAVLVILVVGGRIHRL
jgi:hypothetical protein